MSKINTTSWGEFEVGKLFDIHPTKSYKMTNAELLDGGTSLVLANSAYNNGVGGTSTQPTTEKGGIITNVHIKPSDEAFFELHLDTDDANAHLIKNGDIGEII